ncbi:hypothetical protein TSUD_08510 [Trifolium subterraneum]|nr:hypothetical protein TSUD_08510 [Trifolium subterraneum]
MFDQEKDAQTSSDNTDTSEEDYYDAEILDEMTTFRGELKFRTVNQNDSSRSFNRSFTYGFNEDRHVQILLNIMLKIVVTSVKVRDNDSQFCVDEEDIRSGKRRNHFNFERVDNKFKKKSIRRDGVEINMIYEKEKGKEWQNE